MSFRYEALPRRVRFAAGSVAEVPAEVEALGCRRALVIASGSREEQGRAVAAALGRAAAGLVVGARVHVPRELAEQARARARELEADALVAIGGGSAIGLAKAVALTERLPIVAVPTTYAGSELTPVWGITEAGRKQTGRDDAVLPRSVLYDPVLTLSLSAGVTAASGMNALAHCVEAFWGPRANPLTNAAAEQAMRLLTRGLPACIEAPADLQARETTLVGAWLAAESSAAGSGLHHRLCHLLGGLRDLPHAETHAALLPYTTAFLAPAVPAAAVRIAAALDAEDAAGGIAALGVALGAPTSLGQLGMTIEQAHEAAEIAMPELPDTPRRPSLEELRALLEAAVTGEAVPRTLAQRQQPLR